MNKVNVALGDARAEHAANIMMAGALWAGYESLHEELFATNGLKKYVVIGGKDGAEIVARNSSKEALATNAGTLRHEDFMVIRDKVLEVRRRSLNGVSDLEGAGLTFSVPITDQLIGFETVSEHQEAEQAMNPNSFQNNDLVFGESYVPNPITHQSFSVPWRQQGFDYKRSLGLSESVRQVSDKLENTLFNGNASLVVNFNGANHTLYGYTTHPSRGTGTISDWTLTASQGLIVNELIDQIGLMWSTQGGVANDSVMVYVSNDIWNVLQKDYNVTNPSKTIMDRLRDIAQVRDIKPAEKLAAKSVVLVEMSSRTIELAKAADVITVPHTKTNPMAPQAMTTYAAMVAQIKVDSLGQTGIRHLSI